VQTGLENAPQTFLRLFQGKNLGKQLDDFTVHGFRGYATVQDGRAVVKPLTGPRERR